MLSGLYEGLFCNRRNPANRQGWNTNMTSLRTSIATFVFGLIMGSVAKLLDIYTSNLGNVFSQMSIWILIGVVISIRSQTKARAAINVFCFCIGMLITYYVTAELTSSSYSMTYIAGWSVFTLCSPLFAALAWMTNRCGVLPLLILLGIPFSTLVISIILFDGPRVYDILIIAIEIYILFWRRYRNMRAEWKEGMKSWI